MFISIILPSGKQIHPNRGLPVEFVTADNGVIPSFRNFLSLKPGDIDDQIDGVDVLINGMEYVINYRKYDLAAGYAIRAKLTPDGNLIPLLRKSFGKETRVARGKNEDDIDYYWPILERVWTEPMEILPESTVSTNASDVVERAMDVLSEIQDIPESFSMDNPTEDQEDSSEIDPDLELDEQDG